MQRKINQRFPTIFRRFCQLDVDYENFSFRFQVIITFRIGWRRSYDSSTSCDQSTISSGQLIGIDDYLKCQDRCYGNVGSLKFSCTDFSVSEDWTIGTNSFQYTFPIPSISPRYYQVKLVYSDLYKL